LKDLIGVLNISGRDFDEAMDEMSESVQDVLLRLLAMARTAGG
jgi:hypothetical protein